MTSSSKSTFGQPSRKALAAELGISPQYLSNMLSQGQDAKVAEMVAAARGRQKDDANDRR